MICLDGCSEGDTRLYGGYSDREGMVQQCNSTGGWEAVCDVFWGCEEAVVTCRQLGHNDIVALYSINYGAWTSIGFGPYSCSISDTSLSQCTAYPQYLGTSNCEALYDTVYVNCSTELASDNCTDGDVRLVDGTTDNEGRIEYCIEGTWSGLCTNYYYSHSTANAMCRTLGYITNSYGLLFNDGTFGRGKAVSKVAYIVCSSNDITIDDCFISQQKGCGYTCTDNWNHYGLRCYEPTGCNEGEIRLADGLVENEGRVEICVNGVWGSVCDNSFDTTDGHIVCTELGIAQGALIYYNSAFGGGYGPIVYSNVQCEGHEQSLTECTKSTYLEFTCYNTDTVGVLCVDGCEEGDVRISNGTVEVCVDEIWGLIGDEGWDNSDATVVCKQLGYGPQGITTSNSTYGKPRRAVHLNNVHCTGDEDHILDCNYHQYLLENGKSLIDLVEVVGVDCRYVTTTTVLESATIPVSASNTIVLNTAITDRIGASTSITASTDTVSSDISQALLIAILVCLIALSVITVVSVVILSFAVSRHRKMGSMSVDQPVYFVSDGNTVIANNRNDTPKATPTRSYHTSPMHHKLTLSTSGEYANADIAPRRVTPPTLPSSDRPVHHSTDGVTSTADDGGAAERLYDN